MSTVPTQANIDEELKKHAVEVHQHKAEVLEAMEEARRISRASNTKRYNSFSEALDDLSV